MHNHVAAHLMRLSKFALYPCLCLATLHHKHCNHSHQQWRWLRTQASLLWGYGLNHGYLLKFDNALIGFYL